MRYKVIYENNRGQRVNLSERPYFLNIEPILDYQWSYSEKEKRRGNIIAGFAKDIQSVDLTLHIMDVNADARDEAVDYFNNVIEADIYDGIAGRLIIGDWYTWGYIIASKNTKWQYGNPVVKKVVKLVREQENWYHVVQKANYGSEQAEELYNFIEEDIKTYEGADTNSLKSLTATINPKQSGSGDPSPDNVRPISGWDSVDVSVCGINVWDEEWELGYYNANTGEPVNRDTTIRTKEFITVVPNTTYYLSAVGRTDTFRVFYYDDEYNFISSDLRAAITNATITTPNDCRYMRFWLGNGYGTTYNNDISINYPSTDHDYHAYQGHTYTTDLPETVYGGTLDVVSGTLIVTHRFTTIDGTSTVAKESAAWNPSVNVYYMSISEHLGKQPSSVTVAPSIYSNRAVATSYHGLKNTSNLGKVAFTGQGGYLEWTSSNATLEAEKASLTETPMQIVYELATPQTYQLTPKQVTTLLGTNNVWADSGDITVEYWDDAGRVKTASGSVVTFSKHNSMSGAGYDYPYDYMADAQSQKRIENPNSVPCDFSITIQGYVDRPEVQIGDNVIAFDLEVPYGAFLTVDSSKKTAIMTLANGEQVNVFGARDPDYYLFEKIKEGKNTVTWNGSFLWEIRMLEERSEPRWHMD